MSSCACVSLVFMVFLLLLVLVAVVAVVVIIRFELFMVVVMMVFGYRNLWDQPVSFFLLLVLLLLVVLFLVGRSVGCNCVLFVLIPSLFRRMLPCDWFCGAHFVAHHGMKACCAFLAFGRIVKMTPWRSWQCSENHDQTFLLGKPVGPVHPSSGWHALTKIERTSVGRGWDIRGTNKMFRER